MRPAHHHSPFLLIALAAIVIAAVADLADSAAGANPVFNSTGAYDYIVSNYNATYGLVRENENIDRYWLWTDNLLANHVLKDYAKSANMNATIRHYNELYDLDFRHPVSSLLHQVALILLETRAWQATYGSPILMARSSLNAATTAISPFTNLRTTRGQA